MDSLRGDHPIKGVFVVAQEATCAEGVFWGDGEQRVARLDCVTTEIKSSARILAEGNLPSRCLVAISQADAADTIMS